MIVVDTTILVYAVGRDHLLREPSRRLIESIRRGRLNATTAVETIQEFVHVRSRRYDRREAAALGRDWAALFSPLVSTDRDDLELALDLYPSHPRLGSFDCLLAAAALRREIAGFVSADPAFGAIPGLRYVDPATPALDELLSR